MIEAVEVRVVSLAVRLGAQMCPTEEGCIGHQTSCYRPVVCVCCRRIRRPNFCVLRGGQMVDCVCVPVVDDSPELLRRHALLMVHVDEQVSLISVSPSKERNRMALALVEEL